MHMADALITPLVGGTMWIAAAKTTSHSINKLKVELNDEKIPMMGVMGAFVFAAQMINFSIPGTGSSGHLGGGMLLAAILGPYAGFLAMAAILTIQALFFADGGLLALGCNIFNLGFYTCFIAYPYIYIGILKRGYSTARIIGASTLSSVVGLQLGAFSVVAQTMLSGKIELSFGAFTLLMQAIHLVIGLVEGLVTAAVINYIWKARPELLDGAETADAKYNIPFKRVALVFILAALLIGGLLSWYASGNPDGLEWSLYNAAGQEEFANNGWLHERLEDLQSRIAVLPDYGIKASEASSDSQKSLPPKVGTTIAGAAGVFITLLLAVLAAVIIKLTARKSSKNNA